VIYNGAKTVFDQSPRQDIVLFGDNLDLSFVTGEAEHRSLAEFFQKKYARENINVVAPVGLAAVGFVLRYRDIMFREDPSCFAGTPYMSFIAWTARTT